MNFPQSHEADFPIPSEAKFLHYDVEYEDKKIRVVKFGALFCHDKGYEEYLANQDSVTSIKLIGYGY